MKYFIECHDYEAHGKSLVSRTKHGSEILDKSLYMAMKWSRNHGNTYHVVDETGHLIARFQNGKRQ